MIMVIMEAVCILPTLEVVSDWAMGIVHTVSILPIPCIVLIPSILPTIHLSEWGSDSAGVVCMAGTTIPTLFIVLFMILIIPMDMGIIIPALFPGNL